MLDSKGLKELVDSLIVEAHELIPKVIAKTKDQTIELRKLEQNG